MVRFWMESPAACDRPRRRECFRGVDVGAKFWKIPRSACSAVDASNWPSLYCTKDMGLFPPLGLKLERRSRKDGPHFVVFRLICSSTAILVTVLGMESR